MARLGQISLKRVQQFTLEGNLPLIRWHKQALNILMRRFGIGPYALIWLSFGKGIVLAWVLLSWLGC